jgi:hypothetical protein
MEKKSMRMKLPAAAAVASAVSATVVLAASAKKDEVWTQFYPLLDK